MIDRDTLEKEITKYKKELDTLGKDLEVAKSKKAVGIEQYKQLKKTIIESVDEVDENMAPKEILSALETKYNELKEELDGVRGEKE